MFAQPTKKHMMCFKSAAVKKICKATLFVALTGCIVIPNKSTNATADALDKTDCDNLVLDDSAFDEPLQPDKRDSSFGALANKTMRPLGGGEGYKNIVARPSGVLQPAFLPTVNSAVLVRTADELRAALRAAERSPGIIYVDDAAEINLSHCAKRPTPAGCQDPRSRPESCDDFTLNVPANTTLASGRGRGGSRGARLFSRTFTSCPLLAVTGPGVRITGLRIHGPDSSVENNDPIHCGGEALGISVSTDLPPKSWATEIDNNELSAWPNATIAVDTVMGVRVHHNVIQFNRRQEHSGRECGRDYGLGYGVVLGPGSAIIEANVFDHNRHDIASDGRPGSSYTARYNLVLTGAVQHSFDVHGGKDRKDCTNVAGSAFMIHHNTFLQFRKPAVRFRGIPMRAARIFQNETLHFQPLLAFTQINASGNFNVFDNRAKVSKFPAWFISFGGSAFWQWREFETQSLGAVGVGDFNGDGAADVMRATPDGWEWTPRGFGGGWVFLNSVNNDPVSKLAFGDFVGNGRTDILRATGSEWQVSESGFSRWATLIKMLIPVSEAAFGDFAGDGKTDAFIATGRRWHIIESFSPEVSTQFRQPFKLGELRFGNFVGDSKLDVLRSTGSEWLVWDRQSQNWNHLNFSNIPLARLVFADFDGDGFTDVARSDNGRWHVSWGGKTVWQMLNTSDLELRSQLIADFNGDGKADVLSRQSPDP